MYFLVLPLSWWPLRGKDEKCVVGNTESFSEHRRVLGNDMVESQTQNLKNDVISYNKVGQKMKPDLPSAAIPHTQTKVSSLDCHCTTASKFRAKHKA